MDRRLLLSSVAYALGLYVLATSGLHPLLESRATFAFLVGAPFVSAYLMARGVASAGWWWSATVGVLPVTGAVAVLLIDGAEAPAYIALAAPLLLAGTLSGGLVAHWRRGRSTALETAAVLLAPVVAGAFELRRPPQERVSDAESSIAIAAPVARVWDEVVRVEAGADAERATASGPWLPVSQVREITLDLPQEAAKRTLRFDDGRSLVETITAWEPEDSLRVVADAPPTAPRDRRAGLGLGDGGFTLRAATFTLQVIDSAHTRLRMRHTHRLATRMNGYLGWWADTLVARGQSGLLELVRARAEDPRRGPKPDIRAATAARRTRERTDERSANSLEVGFSVVGAMDGRTDVYPDSVVVLVRDGMLRAQRIEAPQRLDSITASLAQSTGASWSPGRESNAIVLELPNENGQQIALGAMQRFSIPRERGESLDGRWVVFTYHLTVPKTADNPYGKAWTYTHARRLDTTAAPPE